MTVRPEACGRWAIDDGILILVMSFDDVLLDETSSSDENLDETSSEDENWDETSSWDEARFLRRAPARKKSYELFKIQ
jgi:hypothetical protein